MNLREGDVLRAAKIAARRFFSADPAVDVDDFVSAAAVRIIERDPTTMGAAVHVGGEAIARIVGQVRYTKNTANVSTSGLREAGWQAAQGDQLARSRPSLAEKKKRRFAREVVAAIGRPLYRFGEFGVAYESYAAQHLTGVWFDRRCDCCPADVSPPGRSKQRILISGGGMTPAVEDLANDHYVLLLVSDDGETENHKAILPFVDGRKRQVTLREVA